MNSVLDINKSRHLLYALSKLGFHDEDIKTSFINQLYSHVESKYKSRWVQGFDRLYDEREFYRITYRIIINEMAFKKHSLVPMDAINGDPRKRIDDYRKEFETTPYISATDISSFVYCPVSYCIKKCFEEPEETRETLVGIAMHERNRLVDYIPGAREKHKPTPDAVEPAFYTSQNREFFEDIRNSSIYYVGHDENSKRYFKSSKGTYVGQPDYVFVNKAGEKFIVEEKFRPAKKNSTYSAGHHRAQLSSYITGLDELDAAYGYLVYWYYAYEEDVRKIKQCVVFKMLRAEVDTHLIRSVYQAITALNKGAIYSFDFKSLEAAKCANCIVRSFCGHKTGRLSEVSLPYTRRFYGLI